MDDVSGIRYYFFSLHMLCVYVILPLPSSTKGTSVNTWKWWVGAFFASYLAAAAIYFFLSVASRGIEGGHEAIETFFGYLPENWKSNMAEALFSALRG